MVLRALIYALIAATLTYYSGIGSELSVARPLPSVAHCSTA